MSGRTRFNRRDFVRVSAGAAIGIVAAPRLASGAAQADTEWRHGLSLMGVPRYPPGFPQFDYVRPDAPKGGVLRLGQQGTFDNFNLFVSGVKGELENGIASLLYDTLMTPA